MMALRTEVIAARLSDLGVASPQQLAQAKQELIQTQERFSVILAKQGLLRDAEAGKRLAAQLGSLPQRLSPEVTAPLPPGQIPATVWLNHRLVPIQQAAEKLVVATDDPLSVFALELLSRSCGCPLEAVLLREQDLLPLMEMLGRPADGSLPTAIPSATSSSVSPPGERSMTPAASPNPPVQAPNTETARPGAPAAEPQRHGQPPAAFAGQGGAAAAPRHRDRPTGQGATSPAPSPIGPAPSSGAAHSASRDPQGRDSRLSDRQPGGADDPIVQLVDSMLAEAVRLRASDVHIEAAVQSLRIRYRIDGVLHDVNTPPRALHGPVVSRIKIMGALNIAEKRLPQDGRLQLTVEGHPLDVRISLLPSTHGECIVMRLLDRSQPARGLSEMGLLPEDQAIWEELIRRPHGMVLVTGPTGSGKTTTLYGALAMLNQPARKLITVEDPVEYQLPGVNQVLVRPAVGLTFAAGLRAMLRQAPDVIMVGEIRDQETAQIAIQAALTGHLVLSTLHTNDAASAVTRLIDMGIAPFLVASTVQGVLAQRLIRRICATCRSVDAPTAEERAFLQDQQIQQIARGAGCEACRGSGFFGRIGVFELLQITEPVRQLIVSRATASALRARAVTDGMRGLREDGRLKIRQGLTTPAEVLRVVLDAEE